MTAAAAPATVLHAPSGPVKKVPASETGVAAVGPADVWLLGQNSSPDLSAWRPWVVHFDGTGFQPASVPAYQNFFGAITGGIRMGTAVLAGVTARSPSVKISVS